MKSISEMEYSEALAEYMQCLDMYRNDKLRADERRYLSDRLETLRLYMIELKEINDNL